MKRRNIFAIALAALVLTACEDYTEHNFGSPEELYTITQVNNFTVELTPQNYAELAALAENIDLAAKADTDSTTLRHLQMVAENGCFVGNVTPQDYLPAMLKSLIGNSQYYSCTTGSSITVRYRQGNIVASDAYVPRTGELEKSDHFLFVPKGQAQTLAGSNNEATGQTFDYGYIYTSGSSRYPTAVTRTSQAAIVADAAAQRYLYSIERDGANWLICNPDGRYLYLDSEHNTFQYIEDLGDIDEDMYPLWDITYNAEEQTYDIVNTENQKQMLYGSQYSSAGAYSDKKGEEGYLGIQLYELKKGATETVELEEDTLEVVFTLDEEGWQAKGDYLNQELTGGSTLTDMDAVYDFCGWSVEFIGGIGDLTYVWRYDATYGLRASAYKSSTYYPTDAWAISPAINLKKAEKPVFTFQQAQKYADDSNRDDDKVTDYLKVFVSTDYAGRGGLQTATWTDVTDLVEGTWPDGTDWTYYPMTLDLTPYVGSQNVHVAFRYISTDAVAATWEVKNVVCKEQEESEE